MKRLTLLTVAIAALLLGIMIVDLYSLEKETVAHTNNIAASIETLER